MSIRTRVACIAIRYGRLVLMEKLIPSYFNYKQLTPPGGGLELHETLEEACIREMNEETGLTIHSPVLKGVVSYLNYGNSDHAVTFFFVTHEIQGDLIAKEPNKHIPRWVDIETIADNELVPHYYKEFIRIMLEGKDFLNARLEWNKKESDVNFIWSIM
ncbi:NUDIX hydrolase [Paenibacillus filicis]|uniref:NUDIX hydrolase n=1 Tax=Paenibacillus filicis TaxID=669464 RepID=A0ABU9DS96_9BACL